MKGLSLDDLWPGVEALQPEDLERLIERALGLRAGRHAPRLPPRESELLAAIQRGLPPAEEERFRVLTERRSAETLTPEEHQELLALSDTAEHIQAERVTALAELARLRGTSLSALAEQLGAGSSDAWPAPGRWTYQDYCRLAGDGRRHEVIRGQLYEMSAPTIDHQRTVLRLAWKLQGFVSAHGLGEVFAGPLDILLPNGIATPVQPDIVFFRAGYEPPAGAASFQGVPDLVVEVLSPESRQYDTRTKLAAYQEAGVPEVWLADPQAHVVAAYGASGMELGRGGPGESVASRLLSPFSVGVDEIFAGP